MTFQAMLDRARKYERQGRPEEAAGAYASAAQDAEIYRNAALLTAPTLPAIARYTGVLYDALDVESLRGAAKARAHAPCLGWKVNGAGGDGGSVTLLYAEPAAPLPGAIPIALAPDGLLRRRL